MDESRLVIPAANLLSRVDRLMSRAHARRLREQLREEYRSIREQSPELFGLPGAQDLVASHLTGMPYDNGHYYAFLPQVAPGEKLGLFVFLHGHAGNFRLLIWRWRTLAVRARLAVVAPSCGFGFWGKNAAGVVDAAVTDVLSRWPDINPSKGIWLAGLSAGGNGLLRALPLRRWSGTIFLSATMNRELAAEALGASHEHHHRAIVLNGLRDHNVWPGSVSRGVDFLTSRGVDVDHHVYNEEDHFMLFGEAEDVDARILRWMDRREARSRSPEDLTV